MSEYLGFEPTAEPKYFFLSYSNKDAGKIKNNSLISKLVEKKIPIWYDDGIAAGDLWESEIGRKIKGSICVLFFLSKNTFSGGLKSYSYLEYQLAKFHNKEIQIVQIEDIEDSEIPDELSPWWIKMSTYQKVETFKNNSDSEVDKILDTLQTKMKQDGISSNESFNEKLLTQKFYENIDSDTRSILLKFLCEAIDKFNKAAVINYNEVYHKHYNAISNRSTNADNIISGIPNNDDTTMENPNNNIFNSETLKKFEDIHKESLYMCEKETYERILVFWSKMWEMLNTTCIDNINNKEFMTIIKILLNKYGELDGTINKSVDQIADFTDFYSNWNTNAENRIKDVFNSLKNKDLGFIKENMKVIYKDTRRIGEFVGLLSNIRAAIIWTS